VNNNISIWQKAETGVEKTDHIEVLREITITGTVTDANGEPLPGVTVSVPGTTIGTATDIDGRYSLAVPEGSTLVFSFVGFEPQSIAVGDRSVIDVVLSEDMESLDEVVVTALGISKQQNQLGFSVDVLDGRELDMTQQ